MAKIPQSLRPPQAKSGRAPTVAQQKIISQYGSLENYQRVQKIDNEIKSIGLEDVKSIEEYRAKYSKASPEVKQILESPDELQTRMMQESSKLIEDNRNKITERINYYQNKLRESEAKYDKRIDRAGSSSEAKKYLDEQEAQEKYYEGIIRGLEEGLGKPTSYSAIQAYAKDLGAYERAKQEARNQRKAFQEKAPTIEVETIKPTVVNYESQGKRDSVVFIDGQGYSVAPSLQKEFIQSMTAQKPKAQKLPWEVGYQRPTFKDVLKDTKPLKKTRPKVFQEEIEAIKVRATEAVMDPNLRGELIYQPLAFLTRRVVPTTAKEIVVDPLTRGAKVYGETVVKQISEEGVPIPYLRNPITKETKSFQTAPLKEVAPSVVKTAKGAAKFYKEDIVGGISEEGVLIPYKTPLSPEVKYYRTAPLGGVGGAPARETVKFLGVGYEKAKQGLGLYGETVVKQISEEGVLIPYKTPLSPEVKYYRTAPLGERNPIADIAKAKAITTKTAKVYPEKEFTLNIAGEPTRYKAAELGSKGLVEGGAFILKKSAGKAFEKTALSANYTPEEAALIGKGAEVVTEFSPYLAPGYFETKVGAQILEAEATRGTFGGPTSAVEYVKERPVEVAIASVIYAAPRIKSIGEKLSGKDLSKYKKYLDPRRLELDKVERVTIEKTKTVPRIGKQKVLTVKGEKITAVGKQSIEKGATSVKFTKPTNKFQGFSREIVQSVDDFGKVKTTTLESKLSVVIKRDGSIVRTFKYADGTTKIITTKGSKITTKLVSKSGKTVFKDSIIEPGFVDDLIKQKLSKDKLVFQKEQLADYSVQRLVKSGKRSYYEVIDKQGRVIQVDTTSKAGSKIAKQLKGQGAGRVNIGIQDISKSTKGEFTGQVAQTKQTLGDLIVSSDARAKIVLKSGKEKATQDILKSPVFKESAKQSNDVFFGIGKRGKSLNVKVSQPNVQRVIDIGFEQQIKSYRVGPGFKGSGKYLKGFYEEPIKSTVKSVKSKAGIATYYTEGKDVVVQSIEVNPSLRGKGAGKELIKKISEKYPGRKIKVDAFESARGFYEKLGFSKAGKTSTVGTTPYVMGPSKYANVPGGTSLRSQVKFNPKDLFGKFSLTPSEKEVISKGFKDFGVVNVPSAEVVGGTSFGPIITPSSISAPIVGISKSLDLIGVFGILGGRRTDEEKVEETQPRSTPILSQPTEVTQSAKAEPDFGITSQEPITKTKTTTKEVSAPQATIESPIGETIISTPEIRGPEIPDMGTPRPNGSDSAVIVDFWMGRRRRPEVTYVQPYKGQVLIKGKYKDVTQEKLTRKGALDRIARIVDNTIAAQGRVVPSGNKKIRKNQAKGGDDYYSANQDKFRGFKIFKGRKVQLKDTIIEKKNRRLDTPGETRGLSVSQFIAQGKLGRPRKSRRFTI